MTPAHRETVRTVATFAVLGVLACFLPVFVALDALAGRRRP